MSSHTSQRMPEKMSTDSAALHRLLGSSIIAHIGLIVENKAVVFPTGFAVVADKLLIHGSTGSRWMRAIEGQPVTVTVTKLDGVVVARSTFESSMLYRSAMIFGTFARVESERKSELLDALSDRFIPGRSAEVRGSLKKELAATVLLELPLDDWALRVNDSWPEDEDDDIAGDAWAGHVRFGAPETHVVAAPDLRDGIPIPESVREIMAHPERLV